LAWRDARNANGSASVARPWSRRAAASAARLRGSFGDRSTACLRCAYSRGENGLQVKKCNSFCLQCFFYSCIVLKNQQGGKSMKISEIRTAAGSKDNPYPRERMAAEVGVAVRTIIYWENDDRDLADIKPIYQEAVKKFARKHNIKMEG
jgi:DNA-binding XRE family transcriptional regulator